jgi:putative transposase
MPEMVSLPLHRPHGFEQLDGNAWADLLEERVRRREAVERERRKAKGITVLGRERILRQNPFEYPASHAPRFQMSPRVAAKSKWAGIEALLRNRGFIEKYRAAFLQHLAGVANVLFPFGTFWMRKFGKVVCEAAETVALPVPASG